jgi:hypothetical protein
VARRIFVIATPMLASAAKSNRVRMYAPTVRNGGPGRWDRGSPMRRRGDPSARWLRAKCRRRSCRSESEPNLRELLSTTFGHYFKAG